MPSAWLHGTLLMTPLVPLTVHSLPGWYWPTQVDSHTVASEQLVESSDGQVMTVVICETAVHGSEFGTPPLEYQVHVGAP
jgi:hypothetical protein